MNLPQELSYPHLRDIFHSCDDLGLWCFDRDPEVSCVNATAKCLVDCYMIKMRRMFKAIGPRRKMDEIRFHLLTGPIMRHFLARMKKTKHGGDKFRWASDGDPCATVADVYRMAGIARATPLTKHWIPTKGHRNPRVREALKRLLRWIPNVRLMASIDTSTTQEEVNALVAEGFSTMFFGDDEASPQPSPVKCAKTWKGIHEHCRVCKVGCFKAGRVDVWLKEH